MNPAVIGAAIGAGADILGGLFGNSAQKRANKMNIALQRENNAWMERMSNTAWLRGTRDMLDSGINPMLAVSQGGASTPSTSAATVRPADALSRGISSAGSKAAMMVQLENMAANTAVTREKAKQEAMITGDMIKDRSTVTASDGTTTVGGMDPVTRRRALETAQAKLAETNLEVRDIERRILENTETSTVNSARARADILHQEVTLNELRTKLMQLDIPEKEAIAKWFETVGSASPAAKAVMSISQWIKFMLGK